MKKFALIIAMILFVASGVSAQGFLKKIGKAVKDKMFGNEVGPMFYVKDVKPAQKPEEETVYFS